MYIKPIHSEEEYINTLQEIDVIFNAEPGTPEGDKLEILLTLAHAYEDKHYSIPLPDPIAAIEFHMERLELTRKDLEPFIGNRSRVSEILNRKRPLSLRMIRNLSKGLGISTEVLTQEYPIDVESYPDDNDPTYDTQAGTMKLFYADHIIKIYMKSNAVNERFLLSETMLGTIRGLYSSIVNLGAVNDCTYLNEDPIPVFNWPVCQKGEKASINRNPAGNSEKKRIIND